MELPTSANLDAYVQNVKSVKGVFSEVNRYVGCMSSIIFSS